MSFATYQALIVENELQAALSGAVADQWLCGPVYRKAAYYSWPAFGPVVLLAQGQPPGPGAIVTDIPEFAAGGGLAAGSQDETWLRPGLLELPQGLAVRLGQARIYDAALSQFSGKWRPPAADLAKRLGWGEQAAILSHLGPLEEVLSVKIKLLEQGLLALNQETVRLACRSLVGLGYGATPSGDDLLTGFLSVLAAAGVDREFRLLADCLLELKLESLTTLPGQVQLSYACQKRLSQPLKEAALALCGPGGGEEETFARLVRIGHTSGRDILAGMLSAGLLLSGTMF